MKKDFKFSIPFTKIKDTVLGRRFELSLVFVDSKFSKNLNRVYRKKNKPADILSFPLSKTSGEIFIDLEECGRKYKKFDNSLPEFVQRLFIHGLLHLKGMEHGDTMEKAERRFQNKFKIYGSLHQGRNRHRQSRDTGSRRRRKSSGR